MKTSTKIILLLAILVFAATLSLFVVSKMHEKSIKSGYEWTTKLLPPFSVVVGMGNTDFSIEGCDSNAIALYERKGHVTKLYVRNDTLFVQQTNINKETSEKIVVRSKSLLSIVVSPKDKIAVYALKAGPLNLMCNGGHLAIDNWDEKLKKAHSITTSLKIAAENSADIHLTNLEIKRWSVNLNHAELQTNDVVSNELVLNIKNNSWAEISQKQMSITAVRDSTSIFRIN